MKLEARTCAMDPNGYKWFGYDSTVSAPFYTYQNDIHSGIYSQANPPEYQFLQYIQPAVQPSGMSSAVYQPYHQYCFGYPPSVVPSFSYLQPVPVQPSAPLFQWPSTVVGQTSVVGQTTRAETKVTKVPPWPQSTKKVISEKEATVLTQTDTPKKINELVIAITDSASSDEDSIIFDKSAITPSTQSVNATFSEQEGKKKVKNFEEENTSITNLKINEEDDSANTKVASDSDFNISIARCNTLASKLSKLRVENNDNDPVLSAQIYMKESGVSEIETLNCEAINYIKESTKMEVPTSPDPKKGVKKVPVPEPTKASFELQRRMYKQLLDLYDDFEQECEIANIDPEKVDLGSYAEECWSYIAKATIDPLILNGSHLAEVGQVIVTRALQDPGYHRVAAKLIDFIFQKELNGSDAQPLKAHFRKGVVDACKQAVDAWNSWVDMGLHYCLTVIVFLSSVFQTLKVFGNRISSLGSILLELLLVVATPPAVNSFELMQQLCCVLHECGQILDISNSQKMDQLIENLRDAIVDSGMDPAIRLMLLGPVELRASGWAFSKAAQKYYFS